MDPDAKKMEENGPRSHGQQAVWHCSWNIACTHSGCFKDKVESSQKPCTKVELQSKTSVQKWHLLPV